MRWQYIGHPFSLDASKTLHREHAPVLACPACYRVNVAPGEKQETYGNAVRKVKCSTCRGQATRWMGMINSIPIHSSIDRTACLTVHRHLFLNGVVKVPAADSLLRFEVVKQAEALIAFSENLPWYTYTDPKEKTTREMFSVIFFCVDLFYIQTGSILFGIERTPPTNEWGPH